MELRSTFLATKLLQQCGHNPRADIQKEDIYNHVAICIRISVGVTPINCKSYKLNIVMLKSSMKSHRFITQIPMHPPCREHFTSVYHKFLIIIICREFNPIEFKIMFSYKQISIEC